MEFMIDENLELIFSYLKQSALINASLVCRRWSEVIQNSPFLLKQLDLIFHIQPDYFENQSVFPNGKYRNLTMSLDLRVIKLPTEIIDDLNAQSKCIRNATFVNFDRMKSIQILSKLKNITKLVITNYQTKKDVLGVIDLPMLTHLELINSLPFVEVIDSHFLNTLKICSESETRDNYYDLNAGLNNFLSKCNNLKDLTLSNIQITNPNLKSESFEFNLEALTIEDFSFDEENLVDILVKQKNSLKKLAIFNFLPKPIISAIIFSQLTLDELEIDVCIIPNTFNPQRVNRTVKKLSIKSTRAQDDLNAWRVLFYPDFGQNDNHLQLANLKQAIEKIISTCNVVEEFIMLAYAFDSLLKHLNRELESLKVLKLQTIPNFVIPKYVYPPTGLAKFRALEVIEIDKISTQQDIKNCTSLVLHSPNLKVLKINFMEREIFTSDFFIKIVKKSKNLREIHIGVRCIFTLDMIDAVRQLKDLGYPLETISLLFCLFDDKIDKNDALLDEIKLNFQQNSNKLFSSIINKTRLGRMERKIDEKRKDLEHQRLCGVQRELEIERYKLTPNLFNKRKVQVPSH